MAGVLLVYYWCIAGMWLELRTNPLTGRLDVVKVILTLTLTVTLDYERLGRCLKVKVCVGMTAQPFPLIGCNAVHLMYR